MSENEEKSGEIFKKECENSFFNYENERKIKSNNENVNKEIKNLKKFVINFKKIDDKVFIFLNSSVLK